MPITLADPGADSQPTFFTGSKLMLMVATAKSLQRKYRWLPTCRYPEGRWKRAYTRCVETIDHRLTWYARNFFKIDEKKKVIGLALPLPLVMPLHNDG